MTNIRNAILTGAFFTGLSKYLSLGINLIVTAILARLLAPEDFGVVALTVVFTSFFDILATGGMVPAIIQNDSISDLELSDLFSFSLILSVIFCLIFILLIVPISNFFSENRLRLLLLFLSIQLIFNTLNVVPRAVILKAKNFRLLSIISSSGAVFWGFVSIISAYAGLGIYALIVAPIGSSCSNFVLNYIFCKKKLYFKLKFSLEPVKKIFSFSVYQLLFNFINFFSRNLDKILLGRYLGMGLLGYYEKSYKLMTLPISTLTNVLTPAIQPVLVKYQNERSVAYNVYLKFTDTLLLIGFALMPFLFFSSNECILLVFGSQWRDAIPVFSILSISVPFQLVDSISGSIFQSTNKVVYLLKSGFLCALINILFLVLGLILGGLQLVASFVTLSFILNFIISSYYINKLVFGKTLISYLTLCGKHIPVFITISLSLLIVNMFPLDIVSGFLIKLIISVSIFISYCRIRKIKLLDV